MLNHEWTRQRDRRIRQGLREPRPLDGLEDEEPVTGLEDGLAEALDEAPDEDLVGEVGLAPDDLTALEDAEAQAARQQEEADLRPEAEPAAGPADEEAVPEEGAEPEPEAAAETRAAGPREVVQKLEVPLAGLRERLQAVLARQTQLPLDIEARRDVTEQVEGSPRETREVLLRRLLDPTLTLEETALLLGVCPTTVRRYTNRGVLACYRTPGNQRRFHLTDILDFMERQSTPRA
jgi:excisionase family DNA binding protein